LNQAPDPVKSSEGANKTLNRLVAGDFLESLGKELGLEVPPDSRPGPSLNNNTVSLLEQKDSPKGGDDKDFVALTQVGETKSKDFDSTVDSSREKKRSHSRHSRKRSKTLDSDSDSDSDSDRGHRSKSKRKRDRRDKRDKSRSPDSESSDEAYSHRKERKKKHHSRRHREHKRKDYGDKYSDKKRRHERISG
jgi:G patch domain-containing protein 1